MAVCTARCKDGSACKFTALRDSKFCFCHDTRPHIAERRLRARKRGGSIQRRKYLPYSGPLNLATIESDKESKLQVVTSGASKEPGRL